jgi:hypothetical protein
MIAVDGNSTGVINRLNALYGGPGSGYTYVAGDYFRGMSCVQASGNATSATLLAGTTVAGTEIVNVAARNSKKAAIQIQSRIGPSLIKGCYAYKGMMDNFLAWFRDYGNNGTSSSGWGYGVQIAAPAIWNSGDTDYMTGPHVIEDNIVDLMWGESVGVFAGKDVVIQRIIVKDPKRLGIYLDSVQDFKILDSVVLIPSDPDGSAAGFYYCGMAWASERPPKVCRRGFVARNLIVGGGSGFIFGAQKTAPAGTTYPEPSDIWHVHNVWVGQTTKCVGDSGKPMNDATIKFINNVVDGPSSINHGTWERNAFSQAPTTRGLGGGGFVNAALGLLKGTPLTNAGFTTEYCRPSSTSVLLQAGVAIPATTLGDPSIDIEGNTYEPTPTIGAFRSAVVLDNSVAAEGIAIFFGGFAPTASISVNEVEVASTVGGADIGGTAIIRGTSSIANIARLTDNVTSAASVMTGDSAIVMLWDTEKTISQIRVNCGSDETAPRYLVLYRVAYTRGRADLALLGNWESGERDGSGWLSFAVSPESVGVIPRARTTVHELFT